MSFVMHVKCSMAEGVVRGELFHSRSHTHTHVRVLDLLFLFTLFSILTLFLMTQCYRF